MQEKWTRTHVLSYDTCAWHTAGIEMGSEQRLGAALPTSPQVQHPYYTVQILLNSGLYIHFTLVNFTIVQMNEIEPRRSNLAVFPKIRNICYVVVAISIIEIATTTSWKSLWLRSKNNSWCRIGKWHCLKTRRFKTPTCFFWHPRRIFLENFKSHRRVRRSAARRCERRAHRDRKLFLHANLL